ncbi:MAG TPA: aminotransferase class I/II-fold pyridoxal phosphate-dependent enzyme [Vicinamibacterales bacterium]|nr:aminotransferase class I/II-fold pyridoxal phosphate-dependent enzyme [Vicinamibacterales bacterium]
MTAHAAPEGQQATEIRYSLMELAEQLPDVISLGRGDPDLDTPAAIIDRAVAAVAGAHEMPNVQGLDVLRAAIANRYERDKDLRFDPEREILVTNGAQEGLFLTMLALVDRGDRVLVPDPRYSSYDQAIEAAGGTTVEVPTRLERDFHLEPEELSRRAHEGKVLILVNPNNPTGSCIPPQGVRDIAAVAKRAGLTVVSDEIYESLVFDGGSVLSVAACEGMRNQTVTLSGFSKTYAMTGFRVGYLIGPPGFIAAATRLKAATSGPCSLLSQYAAVAALQGSQDSIDEFRRVFDERRRLMMSGLDRLGIPYSHPGGGFYIWANIARFGMPAELFCRQLLTEARVLMFPGTSFGKRWTEYVRISLLQPSARLEEALSRLSRFVTALGAPQVLA